MPNILGINIKKYRDDSAMSIKTLSELAGVGASTISQIESGKRNSLRTETVKKIAKVLNVDVNTLLNAPGEGEYEVSDLKEAIDFILSDDEISIDNEIMTPEEKIKFQFAVKMAINTIIIDRKK